ncbi:hypothetical protein [Reyranella sp. CPCC 100927]|uniref:hypothetical protein n=1 Tax=Reyranella sp. CPCC 100927 TaxID=2599616 RepID=UPI0011B403EB|nr:hypothetical protein [Reyranella sp. CPCC 100927]TWT11742.1 hypothetical protein FQU96_14825 [Reyranella sp. CPCC 100927]
MGYPGIESLFKKFDETALLDDFAAQKGPGVWPKLSRATLVSGLRTRLGNPNAVAQKSTPLCGPASFVRALIIDKPSAYVQAAIDLFNTGQATIGDLKIKPGEWVRTSQPEGNTHQADWIMLASIRDSANVTPAVAFNLGLGGVTPPRDLEAWFTAAGFSTSSCATVTQSNLLTAEMNVRSANAFFSSGHHVAMLIDSAVMYQATQDDSVSAVPTHWVTLATAIKPGQSFDDDAPISLSVFSWGGIQTIPEYSSSPLKKKNFLRKFYGFVAAKS